MSEDTLEGLKKSLNKMSDSLDKTKDKMLDKIGDLMVKSVKKRTIDGKGLKEHNSTLTDFKPLSKSTIKSREYKAKKGKLSQDTKPDKSNLIETGKMVEQIGYTKGDDS